MLGTAIKLVIAAGLMAAVGGPVERGLRPVPDITLLYVGADDCAPCRTWRKDHWPSFAASPQFGQLTYREVVSPKLFALRQDETWPDDLRHHRSAFASKGGVPFWIVTVDGEPVVTAHGLNEWEPKVSRRLKALLR